jgi:hypothetical protein
MAAAEDLVVAEVVAFVVAVAVHFAAAEASAAFEAVVDTAVASAEDMAEASAEDMAATVAGTATAAVIGADTPSVLAGAGQATGAVTHTIRTIMDTPPIMGIRVITDTIPTHLADMAHTDHMLPIRPRLL